MQKYSLALLLQLFKILKDNRITKDKDMQKDNRITKDKDISDIVKLVSCGLLDLRNKAQLNQITTLLLYISRLIIGGGLYVRLLHPRTIFDPAVDAPN
jgi:hypothetical protein